MKEEKKKEAASQLPPISGGDLALQGLMGPSPSPAAAAIANKVKVNKGKVMGKGSWDHLLVQQQQ